ncbi:MAG: tryptophan 7-halogenase [Verrucomicrobiae bacterium]|nr:tryptophan 7-halogenase [Verrucomicrobiae bacterium]
MNTEREWDVLIVGAGPSGSAAATILAGHGHRVLVLERERFPRYHIGESMIPFTNLPMRRLGLIERMERSAFVRKFSVQFVQPNGSASQPFYFFTRYGTEVAQTWQVVRSEFDQTLMEHARSRGAEVWEGVEVKALLREGGRVAGVRVKDGTGEERELRAPMTIDCTGKEAFSAVRQGWRVKDPKLNKVAVWTYYEGAARDEGIDAGATTVAFVPEKGWFWYIPQHENRVSVGVVAEGRYLTRGGVKDPRAIFEREIGENKWIERHLAPGRQVGPHYLTSEYSFHSRHCGTDGLLLAGDAFCFLDPVFSSGLMLALKSGVAVGDAVHEALAEGDLSADRFLPYARTMREGIENMRRLVYAFYEKEFSFKQVIDRYPELAADITDCLSGDVNKDFSRLWAAIAEFVEVPEALSLGDPHRPEPSEGREVGERAPVATAA